MSKSGSSIDIKTILDKVYSVQNIGYSSDDSINIPVETFPSNLERSEHKHKSVALVSPYTITEDDLKEKFHKRNHGRIITQIYAGLIASLSGITFGTCIGWTSQLKDDTVFNKKAIRLGTMVPLGAIFGTISWSYAMRKLGPKKTLMCQSPFYIVLWIVMTFPWISNQFAMVLRFFIGLLGICHLVCGEPLLLDSVHKDLARKMYIAYRSSFYLGTCLMHVLSPYLTSNYVSGICSVIPILHLIMLVFAPESPVYLCKTNEVLARKALEWYRGKTEIYLDFNRIKRDCAIYKLEPENFSYMLYSKVIIKGFFIVVGVTFFNVFSGTFLYLFFSSFESYEQMLERNYIQSYSAIVGFVFYFSSILCLTVHMIKNMPVRPPLISSCLCSSTSLFLLGVYHKFATKEFVDYIYWVKIFLITSLILSVNIGLNYYPKVLIMDYMPLQVYHQANNMHSVIYWVLVFLLLVFYSQVTEVLSVSSMHFCFSAVIFLGAFYCYVFVVETKNKSLIRVQLDLGGNPIGNRGAYFKDWSGSTQQARSESI